MSRNVSNDTPSRSGIMCNSRFKSNDHIAITHETWQKQPASAMKNSTLSKYTGMLSKINDEHENVLCPNRRGFRRDAYLFVRLWKESRNAAGKIHRQLSAARTAAGGNLPARHPRRKAGDGLVWRSENI